MMFKKNGYGAKRLKTTDESARNINPETADISSFFNEGKVRVNLTGLMVLERLRGHNLKRVDEFVTRVKETEFNIFV